MPAPANLVRETSTSTGTGNLTLVQVNGRQRFSTAFGTGGTNVFDYFIMNRNATQWERGTGHMLDANTLVRDTVLENSNGDTNPVDFSAGTLDVANDIPAANQARLDAANVWTATQTVPSLNGGQLAGFRNAVINGAMMVAQRGASFTSTGGANNDDTYNLDRWTLLSSGNNIVNVAQETSTIPPNGLNALTMVVVTTNQKFGIIQFIEQKNCIGLIGNTVTLSFKMKVSSTTNLDNVKAAILAWSGTADTVTSDAVSAWNVEGTNPTLVANWTYENTPVNLNPTTSYATYSVSALIDTAATKNIAVFIWSDVTVTTATTDALSITDVQLEIGSTATPFESRSFGTELALCERYYQLNAATVGIWVTSTLIDCGNPFRPMRADPSMAVVNGTAAAIQPGVSTFNVTAVTPEQTFFMRCTTTTATAGVLGLLKANTIALGAEL